MPYQWLCLCWDLLWVHLELPSFTNSSSCLSSVIDSKLLLLIDYNPKYKKIKLHKPILFPLIQRKCVRCLRKFCNWWHHRDNRRLKKNLVLTGNSWTNSLELIRLICRSVRFKGASQNRMVGTMDHYRENGMLFLILRQQHSGASPLISTTVCKRLQTKETSIPWKSQPFLERFLVPWGASCPSRGTEMIDLNWVLTTSQHLPLIQLKFDYKSVYHTGHRGTWNEVLQEQQRKSPGEHHRKSRKQCNLS